MTTSGEPCRASCNEKFCTSPGLSRDCALQPDCEIEISNTARNENCFQVVFIDVHGYGEEWLPALDRPCRTLFAPVGRAELFGCELPRGGFRGLILSTNSPAPSYVRGSGWRVPRAWYRQSLNLNDQTGSGSAQAERRFVNSLTDENNDQVQTGICEQLLIRVWHQLWIKKAYFYLPALTCRIQSSSLSDSIGIWRTSTAPCSKAKSAIGMS